MLKLPLWACPLPRTLRHLLWTNLQKALKEGPTSSLSWTPLRKRPIVPDSVILLVCAGGLLLCPYRARTSAPTDLPPLTLKTLLLIQKGPKVTGPLLLQAKQTLLLLRASVRTRPYSFRQEPFALINSMRAFRLQHRSITRPAKKDPFELDGLRTNPPSPATALPPTGRLETLRRIGPLARWLITWTLNGESELPQEALLTNRYRVRLTKARKSLLDGKLLVPLGTVV